MSEDVINQIVALCPMVSRDQILKRLEKEKQKTGGFISEVTLLRMIAAEFGCEPTRSKVDLPVLMINDLLPGLNDVSVVGRILAVFATRTFSGANEGKFAGLLIADRTALLRIVLWNDKTDLIDSRTLNVGQIVRFSHGYTREDSSGRPELHLGDRSEVEVNLEGVRESEYPGILKFSTKLGDLASASKNRRVNVVATVRNIFPSSTFERQDSSKGKVMRFIVADDTGEVSVVVWNEKADDMENVLKVGDKLQVVNGKVKKSLGEGVEVNVDGSSYVGPFAQFDETFQIADLKEDSGMVSVEGKVITKPVLRNVNTRRNEQVMLATFELEDKSGRISVSAWRHHAEMAGKLVVGETVLMKNAYVKKGFVDNLELSTRSDTSITVV
jgi:ssDNA-binding replication factor A large subunit